MKDLKCSEDQRLLASINQISNVTSPREEDYRVMSTILSKAVRHVPVPPGAVVSVVSIALNSVNGQRPPNTNASSACSMVLVSTVVW